MMPPTPAVRPARAKETVRIVARLTPARRAASALLPIACASRPNRVRLSRNDQANRTPRTISTTHGTPRTGLSTPRLVLHTATMTRPAAAAAPTLAAVRLAGGPGPPGPRAAAGRVGGPRNA